MAKAGIRRYRDGDYAEVARIWFESSLSSDPSVEPPPDLRQSLFARVARELADGWSLHVATDGERIVGMLALKTDERQLHQLFVDPAFQNLGIGKALLDFAKQAMPNGFWLRTMVRNRAARRFYEREGLLHRQDGPHPNFPNVLFSTYEWTPPGRLS